MALDWAPQAPRKVMGCSTNGVMVRVNRVRHHLPIFADALGIVEFK